MSIDTLNKTVAELKQERALLDSAIEALESIIKKSGTGNTGQLPMVFKSSHVNGTAKSYVDLAEEIIRDSGRDLKIDVILAYVDSVRGQPTNRNSLEATLSSHISKRKKRGKLGRIIKTGPSTYGLPKQ